MLDPPDVLRGQKQMNLDFIIWPLPYQLSSHCQTPLYRLMVAQFFNIIYPLSMPGYICLPNTNLFRQLFCCSIFSHLGLTEGYAPGGCAHTALQCVLAKCYGEVFCWAVFVDPHWPDLKVSSLHCFMSCLKGSSTALLCTVLSEQTFIASLALLLILDRPA